MIILLTFAIILIIVFIIMSIFSFFSKKLTIFNIENTSKAEHKKLKLIERISTLIFIVLLTYFLVRDVLPKYYDEKAKSRRKGDTHQLIETIKTTTSLEVLNSIVDRNSILQLIDALDSKDISLQDEARKALVKIGKSAVDSLIIALKDKNSNVRKDVVAILGEIGDSRAVATLIATLKDESPDVREGAALALGKIKDSRAVEPLIAVLRGKDLKDKDKYLTEIDSSIQVSAAFALAAIGAPAVVSLIAALNDEDPDVREGAARALGKIKDSRAVEPLVTALKNDNDSEVQREIAKAVGLFGLHAWEKAVEKTDIISAFSGKITRLLVERRILGSRVYEDRYQTSPYDLPSINKYLLSLKEHPTKNFYIQTDVACEYDINCGSQRWSSGRFVGKLVKLFCVKEKGDENIYEVVALQAPWLEGENKK